jgi:hypothetical protein
VSLNKLQTETRNTHEKWVIPLVAVVKKKAENKIKIKGLVFRGREDAIGSDLKK